MSFSRGVTPSQETSTGNDPSAPRNSSLLVEMHQKIPSLCGEHGADIPPIIYTKGSSFSPLSTKTNVTM